MKDKNSDSDSNRTVGNIKGRPVVFADIKIKEIGNFAESDPVDEIADSSAENQRKTNRQPGMGCGCLKIKI